MATNPVDAESYITVLKKTRKQRQYFFITVLMYIPALFITYQISPTNRAMGIVFALWVALLIIVTFKVALSRCPRCGNYFHMHGMALLVLRRCLHCQLHITDDKIE